MTATPTFRADLVVTRQVDGTGSPFGYRRLGPDQGCGSDGSTRPGTTAYAPMPVLEVRNPELVESVDEER